jgi:hypothetical protein
MKKEFLIIFLTLLIGFVHRLISWMTDKNAEVLTYTALLQLILVIIYCAYLITTENRAYIKVLLSFLLIGFIGNIMDIYTISGRAIVLSFAEISHFLLLIQIVVDNLRKKDKHLLTLGFVMALSILTQFVLALTYEDQQYRYVLNIIVLIFGLLLIRREISKGLIVESYIKILTLQYALGSVSSIFYLVEN